MCNTKRFWPKDRSVIGSPDCHSRVETTIFSLQFNFWCSSMFLKIAMIFEPKPFFSREFYRWLIPPENTDPNSFKYGVHLALQPSSSFIHSRSLRRISTRAVETMIDASPICNWLPSSSMDKSKICRKRSVVVYLPIDLMFFQAKFSSMIRKMSRLMLLAPSDEQLLRFLVSTLVCCSILGHRICRFSALIRRSVFVWICPTCLQNRTDERRIQPLARKSMCITRHYSCNSLKRTW